jgi:hypothetical protein
MRPEGRNEDDLACLSSLLRPYAGGISSKQEQLVDSPRFRGLPSAAIARPDLMA